MMTKLAAYTFASTLGSIIVAQATEQPVDKINAIYAFKDLGVAGLLMLAVIYLYRKLEQKEKDAREQHLETQAFVKEQTTAFKEASDSQATALGEVVQALGEQKSALEAVVAIQRDHINRILDQATDQRKRP